MAARAAPTSFEPALGYLGGHVRGQGVAKGLGADPELEGAKCPAALKPGQAGMGGVAGDASFVGDRDRTGPRMFHQLKKDTGVGRVDACVVGHMARLLLWVLR